jgi:hypothetical protein
LQILLELAERNPAVENFLIAKFDPTAPAPDFANYRAYVRSEFFPDRGIGDGNPSITYRMLQQVEAEATHPRQVIDFLYFCVETGVEFTNAYGDIDEEFYMSFEDLFERAAKLVSTNGLVDDYLEQARNIVMDTAHIGWGFHDELESIFKKYLAS